MAIFSAVLMALTTQLPTAAASSGGGTGGSTPSASNTTVPNPYEIPPSLFPLPANFSAPGIVTAVSLVPLPGATAGYGLVLATTNASGSYLWFDEAQYSSTAAAEIATNGTCGPGCGDLPFSWSTPVNLTYLASPASSVRLVSAGGTLVAAASVNGSTSLFSAQSPFSNWSALGPTLSGRLGGLAGVPGEVAVATFASGSVGATLLSTSNWTIGNATLYPSGSGATGVAGAGIALTPFGATYLESVVFSVDSTQQLQFTSSTDGASFGPPVPIGNFSTAALDPSTSSLGDTALGEPGGLPGQVALASVDSDLFLLYTSNLSGATVPMTEVSGNNGTNWSGPYVVGPLNGSVADPALAVGPTGLVSATWEEPAYAGGAVDEATFSPDGVTVTAPETIVASSTNGTNPTSAPTIAVDGLARPLLLWPEGPQNGTNSSVAYTGAYPTATTALGLLDSLTNATIGPGDFPGGAGGADSTSLLSNVTSLLAQVNESLASGHLCNAQNETAVELYQNLTHLPLAVESGGPVCARSFDPSLTASSIESSNGVYAPNTFLALYTDWMLEAEGVTVATSPLAAVTDIGSYSALALSTSLPATAASSEMVDDKEVSVALTPTPYSPTAYELSVAATLPTWQSDGVVEAQCDGRGPAERFTYTKTTTVSATWENVTVDPDGAHKPFNGTTGFASVWVYDLPPDQSFSWSATYVALTTEVEEMYDPCTRTYSNASLDPASPAIPEISLSGTFATTLSAAYGSGLVTATFDGNDPEARVTVAFNNTLPATVNSTLWNASGTQDWSSASESVPVSSSFSQWSGIDQDYVYAETSTSRAGNSTSPGILNDSLAYGSSGNASPETAGIYDQFYLMRTGPAVWDNNSTSDPGPYSNITATTAQVTWYSNESALGFYTYQEAGSSTVYTITGVRPVQVAPDNWSYSIELFGLEPLATYDGTFGVSWTDGSLVEQDQLSGQLPHDPGDPGLTTADALPDLVETDLPFDSVTGTGGGVNLTWNTPSIDQRDPVIDSGYGTIRNDTPRADWTEEFPLSPSEIGNLTKKVNGKNVTSWYVDLNLPLTPGSRYTVTLSLNYSGQAKPQAGSYAFTYHEDTSHDGLTNVEKKLGWDADYSPSGTVLISTSQVLTSNLIASNVLIDPGATLWTDGHSIVAADSFLNYGTVRTGNIPNGPGSAHDNFTSSYGGSGGGASYQDVACPSCHGGNTRSAGGGASSDAGRAGFGSSPPGWTRLTGALVSSWWNSSGGALSRYLSGAAGGGYSGGVGGEGAWGLYIQADVLYAGTIVASGTAGGAVLCGSETLISGGGGGGSVLLAYGLPSGYTAPTLNSSGGSGASCSAGHASGAGGNGWLIPLRYTTPPVPPPAAPSYGSTITVEHVVPNVNTFSTNGLDNDYLEKEYGLNPNTVDTAGSDMLDLWNITFNLGSVPASQPTTVPGILTWNEVNSTSWDPWGPGGAPLGRGTVPIACTGPTNCPGNSSSISSYIWNSSGTHSALSQFLNLSGVKYDLKHGGYLRGVLGTCPAAAEAVCGTDRLLTLWGKLSWGANPLAASTPGDGIPDGARVNPVGGTDLQVTVTSWSAANSSSNFRVGNGLSAYINAESSGVPDYGNFTNQTNVTSSWLNELLTGWSTATSFDGAFVVTFPVDPTEQDAQLNLSLVQDTGTDGGTNGQTPLRTPVYSVDLEDPSTSPSLTVWSNVTGASYMLAFHYQVLPVQGKAPTWIYIPSDDSSLSSLPNGLQRYTGEQNFVELVINDTAAPGFSPDITGLPYADGSGGDYNFALSPGLNNLLIPRSVFLTSPLGESILNVSGSGTPDIPINETSANSVLQWEWVEEENGGLWYERATDPTDYPASSGQAIEVVANNTTVNTTDPSLAGGVPADPSLEQNYSTLAIQAIYAFNESDPNEVEGLLAGLLLNTSGNFTGWMLNATGELDTLGLLPSVMAGLANATYTNDGGYGPPNSSATAPKSPLPWYKAAAAWVWGSVSGVATEVISIVWNAVVAAATFVADLVKAAPRFALVVLSQTAGALEAAGAVIRSALNDALEWIVTHLIDPSLSAILGPIRSGVGNYDQTLNSPLNLAWSSENSSGSVGPANAAGVGTAFVNGAPFLVALGIGVTLTVALSMLTPFDVGPSFVVDVVIGLIAGATIASIGALSGAAQLSSSAVNAIETLVNPIKSFPSTEWGTLGGVIGLLATGDEIPWSWLVLSQALLATPPVSIWTSSGYTMAAALTALVIGVVAVATASPILLLFSFVMACVALFAVTFHFLTQVQKLNVPPLTQLGWVDVGLSVSAIAGSAADLGLNWQRLERAF